MDYRKIAKEFCNMRIQDAKKVSQIEQAIAVKGETNVLLFLVEYKEGVLAGQIAKKLGLSASRATNILNSLEKKGMIERKNDCKDKRKVYISITDAGRKKILDKYNEVVGKFELVFRELGEEDTREFVRIMKRLMGIIGKSKG